MSYIIQNETGWFWSEDGRIGFWSKTTHWALVVGFFEGNLLLLHMAWNGIKAKLVKVTE